MRKTGGRKEREEGREKGGRESGGGGEGKNRAGGEMERE
jgi:hypothetical protein